CLAGLPAGNDEHSKIRGKLERQPHITCNGRAARTVSVELLMDLEAEIETEQREVLELFGQQPQKSPDKPTLTEFAPKVRCASDSPLEGAVTSELVSVPGFPASWE